MSLIDRIKNLKPKHWAMIIGSGAVVGLGVDYYRRRDASIAGRMLNVFHPSAPPPPPPPPPQRAAPPASGPSGGPPPSMMLPPPQMGATIIEQVPGALYVPYAYETAPWHRFDHFEHFDHASHAPPHAAAVPPHHR